MWSRAPTARRRRSVDVLGGSITFSREKMTGFRKGVRPRDRHHEFAGRGRADARRRRTYFGGFSSFSFFGFSLSGGRGGAFSLSGGGGGAFSLSGGGGGAF